MDSASQNRVSELRQEIASLQHDNNLYKLKPSRNMAEVKANELRKSRLLAIQEELLKLNAPRRKRIQ